MKPSWGREYRGGGWVTILGTTSFWGGGLARANHAQGGDDPLVTENKWNIFNKIICKKPLRNSKNENDSVVANCCSIARDTVYLIFRSWYLLPKVLWLLYFSTENFVFSSYTMPIYDFLYFCFHKKIIQNEFHTLKIWYLT